jgi:membrane fusion protein (multidrug efflux system)
MPKEDKRKLLKRMVMMLLIVGVFFGGIFAWHAIKNTRMKKAMAHPPPPVTVSAIRAEYLPWQPKLESVGSLRALRGVDLATEVSGLVRRLHFKSGDDVRSGKVLLELDSESERAQLRSLEAAAELARTVYERDKKQLEVQAVSQATVDTDAADLKSKRAQVAQQAAIVRKKTILAPFAGRLGISTVNPGQYLNPGDKIVTLQSLDFLLVDFYLPQQELPRISLGQKIAATTDSYPGRTFPGKITAINPRVEPDSRNFQVEAAIMNPKHLLLPGMFASIEVKAGEVKKYITLPQTAVSFNPYGETVFIIEESTGPRGKKVLTAKQVFVTTGPVRGDQIAIISGVEPGQLVVTSGQIKLKSGSRVVINNRVQPSNNPAPAPVDE